MEQPFQIGDLVRLKTGKSPLEVRQVKRVKHDEWYIRGQYLSQAKWHELNDSAGWQSWRDADDYVLLAELNESETKTELETIMTKPSLYQTKEKPIRYGTFLIKNSSNQMVLEMRGEHGAVESFEEDAIEVVTPFTAELTQLGINDLAVNGSIHIVCKKGQLSKDEVLLELNSGCIWRVTIVDSKCLTPRDNTSKWMKIPATFIKLGDQ